ncbi:hypothetical protein CLV63_12028 [Murinocardiopsis flavida]|uniref:Uncharacterized protein n=1 Tax=Murinocardiopsis flavida TaxID=645275 RepID=A0A2P8D261_9ACTN|nr:hypothetical protein [Murinocardiopsis flavida]PSK91302.1 hypothetical protein CLV63_12028 [Murinocardiopsis flavida]
MHDPAPSRRHPRHVSRALRTAALAAAVLTAVSGCLGGSGGEPKSDATPSPTEKADPPGGGPTGKGMPDIGGVRTAATANDTIQLATVPPAKGDSADIGVAHEPRLTIVFESSRRKGDDVVFTAEAEYHGEKGGYELHSNDFTAYLYKKDRAENAESWAAQLDTFPVRDDGMLASLDAAEPKQDFSFTVPEVRPLADGTGLDSFGYIEYETPEKLWGYDVKQQDPIPGRLCYQEGEGWHDLPLFPEVEVPCG